MRTLAEFEQRFATEDACRTYLAQLRWPTGFCCPQCRTSGSWTTTRCLLMCRQCGYQASVTAGTIFHRTRLPLQYWFRAVWGIEARGGRRHLGSKALVAIAAQIAGKGIGRIHLRRIPAASASPRVAFVKHAIKPGSVVITDGWEAYAKLKQEGFKHRPRVINASSKTASGLLPRVHRVASLFKRWLLGTHQGALSREQLDSYLNEFTFRFNRRTSRYRWKMFYRLMAQAVAVEPAPYSTRLIAGTT